MALFITILERIMMFNKIEKIAQPFLEKIIVLPFNQELAQGTLPMEKFVFYLQQDAHYLAEFSKALALTATKLPNNQLMRHFLTFSLDAITAERSLHNQYLKSYNIIPHSKPSPSCFMYTNYLLQTASIKSVEESVASLLPCFWVYREVGRYMARISDASSKNVYQAWINLYAGHEFSDSVTLAIETFNKLVILEFGDYFNKIVNAFMQSTKLEWLFWHSAYQMERWLI